MGLGSAAKLPRPIPLRYSAHGLQRPSPSFGPEALSRRLRTDQAIRLGASPPRWLVRPDKLACHLGDSPSAFGGAKAGLWPIGLWPIKALAEAVRLLRRSPVPVGRRAQASLGRFTSHGACGATPPSAAPQETTGRRSPLRRLASPPRAFPRKGRRSPNSVWAETLLRGVRGAGAEPLPRTTLGADEDKLRLSEDVPRGGRVRSPTARSLRSLADSVAVRSFTPFASRRLAHTPCEALGPGGPIRTGGPVGVLRRRPEA